MGGERRARAADGGIEVGTRAVEARDGEPLNEGRRGRVTGTRVVMQTGQKTDAMSVGRRRDGDQNTLVRPARGAAHERSTDSDIRTGTRTGKQNCASIRPLDNVGGSSSSSHENLLCVLADFLWGISWRKELLRNRSRLI